MTARPVAAAKPGAAIEQNELVRIRALLQRVHRDLGAELDEMTAAVADIARAADRDGDEIDAGATAAHREQQISLLESIRERRRQVDRALQRLDQGGYGRCETCGEAITAERLAAFPSATSCVACKRAGERR